jgi:uncharacterized membrane protein YdbT with pleckstrin-like domain
MSQEQTIWKGNPSFVINLTMDVLSIFVIFCIIFFNVPIYFIALPLLFMLWNFLSIKTTVYQLTTERLKSSYGILNKRIDELELYRVKDYRVEQPLHLRVFGLGNIILDTSDKSNPVMVLRAVLGSEELLNSIRKYVEERRSSKSIREIDIN